MATRTEELLDKLSSDSKRIVGYIMTFVPSQGRFIRLMRDLLDAGAESAEEWLSQYHHCTDSLSFVMEFEGG